MSDGAAVPHHQQEAGGGEGAQQLIDEAQAEGVLVAESGGGRAVARHHGDEVGGEGGVEDVGRHAGGGEARPLRRRRPHLAVEGEDARDDAGLRPAPHPRVGIQHGAQQGGAAARHAPDPHDGHRAVHVDQRGGAAAAAVQGQREDNDEDNTQRRRHPPAAGVVHPPHSHRTRRLSCIQKTGNNIHIGRL